MYLFVTINNSIYILYNILPPFDCINLYTQNKISVRLLFVIPSSLILSSWRGPLEKIKKTLLIVVTTQKFKFLSYYILPHPHSSCVITC